MRLAQRLFLVVLVLGLGGSLLGQAHPGMPGGNADTNLQRALPRGPNTYGGSTITYTISSYDFQSFYSSDVPSGLGGTQARYFTNTTTGYFEAPLRLPAGASITAVEVQGCDTGAGALTVTLYSETMSGGAESDANLGGVTTVGTPGCGFFVASLTTPVTIDNLNYVYLVQVTTGASDTTSRFSAVRFYYNLQVSPAPATATFGDVPTTHPQFKFVEALAAAGITGGCGGGNYCPDSPLTRGQMAVFLSAALGLHWPN
jgi:hypothetical protein